MKQTIIFGNIITMGEITKQKIFAAILMSGMATVLTSCTDREDNPVQKHSVSQRRPVARRQGIRMAALRPDRQEYHDL